jgi:hypothetical protein
VEEVETRAKVTVATDFGSPGAWDAPRVEPQTLRAFAKIPNTVLSSWWVAPPVWML